MLHRNSHILTELRSNPMPLWPYSSPSGGGGAIRYFVLAEDVEALPVMSWKGKLNETTGAIELIDGQTIPFELWYWEDVIRSPKKARAGYGGLYSQIGGKKTFVNGPCINDCSTSASITADPPDGEVDASYAYTVVFTGLDGSGVSATNLPDGLSIDSGTGDITGTPTTAGEKWVTFTGTSSSGSCPVTRIKKIVIAESSGLGGGTGDPV